MKAASHEEFDCEFPERFNWGLIDDPVLGDLADSLRKEIARDLKTSSSFALFAPGLRLALNCLSQVAETRE